MNSFALVVVCVIAGGCVSPSATESAALKAAQAHATFSRPADPNPMKSCQLLAVTFRFALPDYRITCVPAP